MREDRITAPTSRGTRRRRAKPSVLALAACAVVAATTGAAWSQRHNTVSFEEGEAGWYPLFDGRGLDGFVIAGDGSWRVENGEIVADSGGIALLLTDETFSDFELRVDFLAAPGANSGVFLRVSTQNPLAGGSAYEVNIAPPDNVFPTGSVMHVVMPVGSGAPKFAASQKVEGAGESEDWRTFHVVANGGRITVTLDGEKIVELDDPEPLAEGYIGLQHNQGRVAFRNLKARRLRL